MFFQEVACESQPTCFQISCARLSESYPPSRSKAPSWLLGLGSNAIFASTDLHSYLASSQLREQILRVLPHSVVRIIKCIFFVSLITQWLAI